MPLQSHLASLEQRHRDLDRRVEEEKRRPACDSVKLLELKKRKLHLKDEMERLKTVH